MTRNTLLISGLLATMLSTPALAEPIPVRHIQLPLHRFMVTRSETGNVIASDEFSQSVQGNEVTMRLTYRFADGSIDDETTTYNQQGTFRLVRDRHIETGPAFPKPVDFTVEVPTGIATKRIPDKDGAAHSETRHIDLPDDLANGIVGTLLLNVSHNSAPFRVGLLVPLEGGRLIHILISPEGEQSFRMAGQTPKAAVFRIHPELGGIVGWIASLIGIQPKDVMVWVMEGPQPAVVKIVGQLGGYGPVVTSVLQGASF
jgi:hypothetical protein